MRRVIILLLIATSLFACKGKKENPDTNVPLTTEADKGYITYSFKVNGLQDSVVADSIWRIIFQVEGVDKLILSKNDSTAVFTVDPKLIDREFLKNAITTRGGKVLN